jgi:hypothetical protein
MPSIRRDPSVQRMTTAPAPQRAKSARRGPRSQRVSGHRNGIRDGNTSDVLFTIDDFDNSLVSGIACRPLRDAAALCIVRE